MENLDFGGFLRDLNTPTEEKHKHMSCMMSSCQHVLRAKDEQYATQIDAAGAWSLESEEHRARTRITLQNVRIGA